MSNTVAAILGVLLLLLGGYLGRLITKPRTRDGVPLHPEAPDVEPVVDEARTAIDDRRQEAETEIVKATGSSTPAERLAAAFNHRRKKGGPS